MKTLKIACAAIVFIIVSISAKAKWAIFDDAPIKTSYTKKINIDRTGKIKEVTEAHLEILKEPGRNIAANYTLQYDGDSTKIKILEAKTIYHGKEYKLDKNLIEDKPLASPPQGFDQIRQILLAFPKAEIGAKIFLKYEKTIFKVPLDNFYANLFSFGYRDFEAAVHIKLYSQIPLHIVINDPQKVLNIKKDAEDNFHNLEINLIKPIYQEPINEPSSNIVNNKHLTWVSISSLNKWTDLAVRFSKLYAPIFTQTLPQDFGKIADLAAQKTDEAAQINTVTSLLNDKIQYMGDWRTIKGGYVPRSLEKISKTQLGDCKDFSASTAAILAKLGFNAQVALVRRGIGNFYPDALPDINAFNHAFVKITNKQGKVYWIDPTNFQSMADGIFPDIAGKMALILDAKAPDYEQVANINPKHAQFIATRQLTILDNNKIIETGNITFKNEEAYMLTGITMKMSETAVKDAVFDLLSGSRLETKNKINMQLPNLNSRIVKDITFSYAFEQENRTLKTNLGQALKLSYNSLHSFFDVAQNFVTDVLIAYPFTAIGQTVIKNINVQNIESLNKEINTPWVYVARKCNLINNHDLQINDTIIIYKNLIPNKELKTPEFIKLKDDLEKSFKDVAVVFTVSN